MTREEIENVLASLFKKRTVPFDSATPQDWNKLNEKFGTHFSNEFILFMELVNKYQFRGEILNITRGGYSSSNDTIAFSYDFEMKNGDWQKDMIPFYNIGNGDYFCLSASAGEDSPVFYFYHDDGRFERYSDMALENTETVDAVGIENNSDFAVLTIADEWDWQVERTHLLALQAKLNAYFRFVESGQILESYPEAAGRQLVIDVIGKFPLPQSGIDLLTHASDACAGLGIRIRYRHYPGPQQ
ncbi:SMI1/KNR4 family protein [Pedosphaera parvula]|uniref:Knr4/Smi1-like domain-containing protein n=1 Tax=Pedosphaera parvula (strain Ellin514) TaxID=320771 RepID=B9XKD3_PEDPL|nr:SMI1/KNR4 family protein [Pedosphaera parvula]EEF59771.1 hypothetical protein Cflav_PD2592 [Pedosphaera parvula Ellin514]